MLLSTTLSPKGGAEIADIAFKQNKDMELTGGRRSRSKMDFSPNDEHGFGFDTNPFSRWLA